MIACLWGLLSSGVGIAKGAETTNLFETAVTEQLLDPAAYAEWVDGAERPVTDRFSKNPEPKNVMVTRTSLPGFIGAKFGDSKTPGPRHLRIGFTSPVPVGTLLVSGDVAVSVLKPNSNYPGNLADDSQWIPATRAESDLQPDDDSFVAWLLPPNTTTRALRFTHDSSPLDKSYVASLHGAYIIEERFANVALLAAPSGQASKAISKINNGEHDSWGAWENINNQNGERPRLIADEPEWLLLTWPEPVKIRGMSLIWAGFGAAEIQTYSGPDEVAPGDASETAWQTLTVLTDVKNRYPTMFAPYWTDFGKEITTRALRLRITAVSGEASAKDRHRDGKRVWLGEWMVFSALGNHPAEAVSTAFAKRLEEPAKAGAIPVNFTLPEAGYVTLVIDDVKGTRVRNLISETPFPAGKNTVWWDGSDDLGRDVQAANLSVYNMPFQPVAPGEYHVHGLWRKEVVPHYEFSVYAPGSPPWGTEDHTGGWIANHSPPQAALFVPGGERSPTRDPLVYLGCLVTEGPDAVAWVDLDGRKRGGRKWIGGTWTGAPYMAYDSGSKPDPAVSVYVGTGWQKDNVKDSSILRLNTLTPSGDSKSVMDVDLGTLPANTKMSESLSGLSARDGVLVCSLIHLNELLFVNAKPGETTAVTGRIPLESPRGSVFDSQGRFIVLSGTKLLRFPAFPSADSPPQVIIASGLEDPKAVALDTLGNFYVSDWGTSHQVKVFSPKGEFLRAIGVPGVPKAGPYDPGHMNHPAGITIDSKNQLWVAEKDDLPRRVSVWSLDGKLINAFYGPGKYGGGGVIDPQDKTRFYYAHEGEGSMEFRLDWDKGTSELVSVIYRADSKGSMELPRESSAPETPVYFKGRRYFTNAYNSAPVAGNGTTMLFLDRDGVARPVAALGRTRNWNLFKEDAFRSRWPEGMQLTKSGDMPDDTLFLWCDTNGDAQIQPEEVEMIKSECRGVTLMPDLSFCVANMGSAYPKTMGKSLRFAPVSFDARGAPRYDLSKGQVLAENVKFAASSGGDQSLTDESGWTVVSLGVGPFDARSLSGTKDGLAQWSYPSLWPGLHAGQRAPRHSFPGQIIGSTRLLGGFFKAGQETLWAINSDQGGPYVFTRDGLFVATLFEDVRLGKAWHMPAAQRGMSLKGLTLSQENFWPTITSTPDGAVLMVDGTRCAVVSLEGLDTIKRIDAGRLNVTADDLARSEELLLQREADRQRQQGSGVFKITPASPAPQVDGQLDDWKSARWVEIDQRGRENITASVVVANGSLFAAWKTSDPRLLENTGENPLALFKTGGALDLMIGANPNADPKRKQPEAGDVRLLVTQVPAAVDAKGRTSKLQTKAMLYRAIVPGTPETARIPFSSPWRTIYFDKVEDVSDQVILATDKKGNFELSVPLELLLLRPALGMRIRGDIGILRGNGSETTNRIYWSNKATSIVSDVPSEAQLTPALWGPWEFTQP